MLRTGCIGYDLMANTWMTLFSAPQIHNWIKKTLYFFKEPIFFFIEGKLTNIVDLFTCETVLVCHSTVYQLLWGWAELAVGVSRRSFCWGGGSSRERWNVHGERLAWYPCTNGLRRVKITQAAESSRDCRHRTHRTGATFLLKDTYAHTLSLVTTVIRQLLCVKVPLPAGVYGVLCLNK